MIETAAPKICFVSVRPSTQRCSPTHGLTGIEEEAQDW